MQPKQNGWQESAAGGGLSLLPCCCCTDSRSLRQNLMLMQGGPDAAGIRSCCVWSAETGEGPLSLPPTPFPSPVPLLMTAWHDSTASLVSVPPTQPPSVLCVCACIHHTGAHVRCELVQSHQEAHVDTAQLGVPCCLDPPQSAPVGACLQPALQQSVVHSINQVVSQSVRQSGSLAVSRFRQ